MPLLAVTQTHLKPIDALNSFLNTPSAGPIIGLLIFVGVIKLILALASPPKKSRIKSKRSSNGHSVSQMALQSPPQATSRERSRPVSAAAKARGEKAEIIVRDELAMELQPDIYFVFHDILIPTAQGNLAQIDHVVVSVFGVFVIETKHIGGWIFGKADDPRWTHQFPDGTKEDRQNPLLQNQGHIRALAQPRPPHWECGTQNWTGPRCHEGWNDGFHQILPKSTVHPRRCTEDVSSDHDGRPVQMFDCKGMSFAVRPAQGPSSKCGLRKGAKQSDGSSPVVHPVLRRATPNSLLEFPAGWFLVGSYE